MRYVLSGVLWVVVIAFPILTGLVLRELFDRFSQGTEASLREIAWLLVAFVALDVVRQALFWLAIARWPQWWNSIQTVLRTNVLRSILCARGPAATRLPASSGEALNRFRDDVEDILLLVDIWIDLTGDAVFAAIALAIMYQTDSRVTLVVVLPMIIIIVVTRSLSDRIKATHSAARAAAANVSEQLGGLFGGVLSLKVAGAEKAAIARLREHNAVRRDLEVRARLLTDLLDTLTASSVELSTGIVLLLVAPAMRSGRFTVGDLALFTAYVGWLAGLRDASGARCTAFARRRSPAGGSYACWPSTRTSTTSSPTTRSTSANPRRPPRRHRRSTSRSPVSRSKGSRRCTHRPDAVWPTCRSRSSAESWSSSPARSVRARRRSCAPSSACCRSSPGRCAGTATPSPMRASSSCHRAAYAAQVPRLWSASLRENLRLGWPVDDDDIDDALRLARLYDDVGEMADGLDTLVGPRGVRLSGGQLQRALAARALVRQPELLVVDDLSSALDVETERALWDGLTSSDRHGLPAALLVVSHRPNVLDRADRVVVLDGGRILEPTVLA